MFRSLCLAVVLTIAIGQTALAIITAHVQVVDSTPGEFVPLEVGTPWIGYNPGRYEWYEFPDVLIQEPQLSIWQVAGEPPSTGQTRTDPRSSYGIISFEVLTDGLVLLSVTNRWGGGGNPSGGWIPELTTQQEFIDDGWVEFAGPMKLYNNDIDAVVDDTFFTVYGRESSTGERFTYRTEKYHPPHLLTTQFTAVPEPINIDIDIRDSINLKSKGVLPVAVVSTDDFDVADVDIDSLLFGDPILIDAGATRVSPVRSAFEDITGDGLLDLALKFGIPEMVEAGVLGPLSMEAVLTGSTFGGQEILGSDTFRIVPKAIGAAASVPEPSIWSLLCLTLTAVWWWRRPTTSARVAG